MKRKFIIMLSLFIFTIIFGTIFGLKQFNSQEEVIAYKEYKLFNEQIASEKVQIYNSGCLVGEQVYLSLAQNYKYNNEYNLALNTLKNISECYPGAYKIISEKSLLLLNNIGDIYESWGYYLKEKGDDNYKIKYKKAINSYEKILKVFSKSKDFENIKNQYEEKIKNAKYMIN